MDELKKLYTATYGEEPEKVERLAASGSNRIYFRLFGTKCPGGSVVGVVGQSADENNAFIKPYAPFYSSQTSGAAHFGGG